MNHGCFTNRLIAVVLALALLFGNMVFPVTAEESAVTENRVTAVANTPITQGNTGRCYIYIESLESLSSLDVAVHFDPEKVSVTSSFNQVECLIYDQSIKTDRVQFSYIFDGKGANSKTQLFYFEYRVHADAAPGSSYFDVVVGDAYDSALNILPVRGSRCNFTIQQKVSQLSASIRGISSVTTSINQEFNLTYRFNTTSIASGSMTIHFDPELFGLVEVTPGAFLDGKLTDINASLTGAVNLSFLGTAYGNSDQLLTLRFKTLQNVTKSSPITLTVSDLYDLQLNSIACSGYTTAVGINKDPTYDETAPYVFLQTQYDDAARQLRVSVHLEENARLGAGDFVLQFDPERYAFAESIKEFSPTFFGVNNKQVNEGIFKFSIISMSDITDAHKMLTVVFDVLQPCEDTPSDFTISGRDFSDALTNPIVLNFRSCTAAVPGHTMAEDPAVAPTCLETGLTTGAHCAVCDKILIPQQTVAALGHDEIPHEAVAPTCTEIGWSDYVTCSRCDYTTYEAIPANGHSYVHTICSVCGHKQTSQTQWDVSAAQDGSVMASLFVNITEGGYELEITGSGDMKNWSSDYAVPWRSYRSQINRLSVYEGVTSIGNYAFYELPAITEVALPESLTNIGVYAFYRCNALTGIAIGNQVTVIDRYAFGSCPALTDLTIGEQVTQIGNGAFSNCTALKSVVIPDSVTSIDSSAFSNCTALEHVVIGEGVTSLGDSAFYNCRNLTQLTLNATLPNYNGSHQTFRYCGVDTDGLTVTIGNQVTQIPDYLFYPYNGNSDSAPKIRTVVFTEGSTCQRIGNYAFYYSKLESIHIPDSVTSIGSYAFYFCPNLEDLAIGEQVTQVGACAFYNCTALKSVFIPDSVTSIDSSAFSNCTALEHVVIGEGVTSLGDYAFYNCRNLTQLTLNATLPNYNGNYQTFRYCGVDADGITVTIGNQVTQIPDYLFYPYNGSSDSAPKIRTVVFTEGSTCQRIGNYAFYYSKLESIHIPDSVTSIGYYAFYFCPNLEDLAIGEQVTQIGDSAFSNCGALKSVVIPDSVTSIDSSAFSNCTALEHVVIGEGVTSLGDSAFYNCRNLTQLTLNATLPNYNGSHQPFRYCGVDTDGLTVTIGNQVTQIPDCLFYPYNGNSDSAPKIRTVVFTEGSTCQRIGNYAFYYSKLESIHIPDSVTSIGSYAFYFCPNLEDLAIGEQVTQIGDSAFSHCTALQALTIPDRVEIISPSAFYGCTGLETLTIGERVTTLGNSAFSGCYKLAQVRLNAVAMDDLPLSNYVFNACGRDTAGLTLIVGNQVTRIPAQLFEPYRYSSSSFPNLTGLIFEEGSVCTQIATHAFGYMSSFHYALLPDSITEIGDYAFYNCNNLTLAFSADTLPASLGSNWQSQGYYLNVRKLTVNQDAVCVVTHDDIATFAKYFGNADSYQIPDTIDGIPVTQIGDHAFYDKDSLVSVTLPQQLTHIGNYAFYTADNLRSLLVPATLEQLGQYAFSGSKLVVGFTADQLPTNRHNNWLSSDTPYYLSVDAFQITEDATYAILQDDTAICAKYVGTGTAFTVADTVAGVPVTQIGDHAFRSKSNLTSLELPAGLERIGTYAFYYASGLRIILLPDSVTHIGNSAFSECSKLVIGFPGDALPATLGSSWSGNSPYYLNVQEFVLTDDATCVITTHDEAIFAKYVGSATEYTVPDQVDALPITKIGDRAFYNQDTLISLTLPQNLTAIGSYAFYSADKLRTLLIPSTVTEIGGYAFYNCNQLVVGYTAETLPATLGSSWSGNSPYYLNVREFVLSDITTGLVTHDEEAIFAKYLGSSAEYAIPERIGNLPTSQIGAYAFRNKYALAAVTIPETVTLIGEEAFSGCNKLTAITLPDSVVRIGRYAFNGCSALATIQWPANLEAIERYAFCGCRALTQLVLPESLTQLGESAFQSCTGLQTVVLPDQILRISDYAFYDCQSLTSVTLPSQLQVIDSSAFGGCSALAHIDLPETLTTIGGSAFSGCSALQCITIPESVSFIGGSAFYNCTNLSEIHWNAAANLNFNYSDFIFAWCGTNTDGITVTFGSAVTHIPNYLFCPYRYGAEYTPNIRQVQFAEGSTCQSIGTYAFYRCSNLAQINLPESLTTIESYAFQGTGLTEITIPAAVTQVNGRAFYDCASLQTVYLHSKTVAEALTSASACGYLLQYPQTVVIPADANAPEYLVSNFPYTDSIHHDGADYIVYARDAHNWTQDRVLVEHISCQQDGWIRYVCTDCGIHKDVMTFRHDTIAHEAKEPDCLNIGWFAYDTCRDCDYSTYVERPALGHRVMIDLGSFADPITVTNSEQYPFSLENGVYSSTNKAHGSNASLSVTALYDCTLRIDYGVSSEYGCDTLTIVHNVSQMDAISGEVSGKALTLTLHAGDKIIIRYQKDGSVDRGEDRSWFSLFCQPVWIADVVEQPAEGQVPTCTWAVACHACGTVLQEALGHDEIHHDAQAPGCAAIGWEEYVTCARCDYTTYTPLAALGHDRIAHDAQDPNCTEVGWYAYESCSRCDYTTYQEIAPLGHDEISHNAQEPTCTAIGWEAYVTCRRCNYTTYAEIAPLGHDEVHHDAQAPTCTAIGWEEYVTCTRCLYSTYHQLPANGHSFMDKVCIVCSEDQAPTRSWDISADSDGSIMAYAYRHMDGTYLLEITGSGTTMNSYTYPFGTEIASNTTAVTISDQITHIGNYLFSGFSKLQQLDLHQGLISLGDRAFQSCSALQSITMPESLTHIGQYAFSGCTNLSEIHWNAVSVEDLAYSNYTFENCGIHTDGITVTFGSAVTRVPNHLFSPYKYGNYGTPNIRQVQFAEGSNCQSIGTYAFYRCSNLAQINLPESLTAIDSYAFEGTGLTEITIPAAVTQVNYNAFYGCASLQTVYVHSQTIAERLTDVSACGYLLQYPQTVVISADANAPEYLVNNFPYVEAIRYDDNDYQVYARNEHSWTQDQVLVAHIPCQQDGWIRYVCTDCGIHKDVMTFRHDTIAHEAKEPDCLNFGWLAYDTCRDCDYCTYVERPALGHRVLVDQGSWADPITTADSGSYHFTLENGVYSSTNTLDNTTSSLTVTALYNCTLRIDYGVSSEANYDWLIITHNGNQLDAIAGEVSGKTLTVTLQSGDQVIISYMKDISQSRGEDRGWFSLFSEQVWVQDLVDQPAEGQVPTCTWAVACYACGVVLQEALGHDEIHHEAQAATCTAIGWEEYVTCSRCDYTTYAPLAALGHNRIPHDAQNPNCTEVGWHAYETCSRCDYTTYQEIPALGHNEIAHNAQAPTCTAIGWEAYVTCRRCNYTTYSGDIPALGHAPVDHVDREPTCTVVGRTAHVCSRCSYTTYSDIPVLGHDEIHHDAQAPTCTEIGWGEYVTCSRCDYTTYQEIPANGHSFMDKVCIVCGADQEPTRSWDMSVDGDGSIMVYAYRHMDGTYLVEITGSGVMRDYDSYSSPLGYEIAQNTTEVTISDQITHIGASICYDFTQLKEVRIPEGVVSIGANAFRYCDELQIAYLPSTLDSTGDYVFYDSSCVLIMNRDRWLSQQGSIWDYECAVYETPQDVVITEDCIYVIDRNGVANIARYIGSDTTFTALTEVNGVPVTRIGDYAFASPPALHTYTIPASITSVGTQAFRVSSQNRYVVLTESSTAPSGLSYCSVPYYVAPQVVQQIADYIFVIDQSGVCYLACYTGHASNLTVPSQVGDFAITHIGDYAFYYHSNLQSVSLSEGVVSVGRSAFDCCTSLGSVNLPDSLRTIGRNAFSQCYRLAKLDIPNGVTEISSGAFQFCYDLTEVTIPASATFLASDAFYYMENIHLVTIHSDVLAQGIQSANTYGYLLRNATTVVIPADVENSYLSSNFAYSEEATVDGQKSRIYSNCAHSWTENLITEMVPCQTDGLLEATCESCHVVKQTVTPCHTLEVSIVPPTCTEDGYTLHDCPDCGGYRDNPVEKLGHSYENSPTHCDRCDHVRMATSLAVAAVPVKQLYLVGEAADLTGGVLDVTFDDDQTVQIPMTDAQAALDSSCVGVTEVTLTYGTVTVTYAVTVIIPGDVNNDNAVDLLDSMVLDRYLANWDGYHVNELHADVNRDGTVDLLDSMILARHLAHWSGYEVL